MEEFSEKEFREKAMNLFYNETGYKRDRMDDQDYYIISDIFMKYYLCGLDKGIREGLKANKINWDLPHIVALIFLLTVLVGATALLLMRLRLI